MRSPRNRLPICLPLLLLAAGCAGTNAETVLGPSILARRRLRVYAPPGPVAASAADLRRIGFETVKPAEADALVLSTAVLRRIPPQSVGPHAGEAYDIQDRMSVRVVDTRSGETLIESCSTEGDEEDISRSIGRELRSPRPAYAPRPLCARRAFYPSPLQGEVAAGYGVAVDSAGRIVVAGVASDNGEEFYPAFWRFTGLHEPDESFGARGAVALSTPGWAWSLAIDGQGRMIAAGFTGRSWQDAPKAFVVRLSSSGALGQALLLESPAGGTHAAAFAVAAPDDGSILAVGSCSDREGRVRAAAWRVAEDGSVEGSVLPAPEGATETRANAVLARDGRTLAAGHADWKKLVLWDLGASGLVSTPHGMARGLLAAEDGTVWVAGFRYVERRNKKVREQAVLSSFSRDGSPLQALVAPEEGRVKGQESFAIAAGGEGLLTVGYVGIGKAVRAAVWGFDAHGKLARTRVLPGPEGGLEDRAYALGVDPEGRVYVTGLSRDGSGRRHMALWRLAPD